MTSNADLRQQYQEFLTLHKTIKGQQVSTHTRMPDSSLGVYGGAFTINDDELPEFKKLYTAYIGTGKQEYLTEAQFDDGVIVVDLDFHYAPEIETRQHTDTDIGTLVETYVEMLEDLIVIDGTLSFEIYVSQKSHINMLDDKTKDGIHILFGLRVPRIVQKALRKSMLDELPNVFAHLPLINSWEGVLDEGITNGKTNWTLLGSRKPANKPYEITHAFRVDFADVSITPIPCDKIDKSKISVRCKDFPMVSYAKTNDIIMSIISQKTTPSSSPQKRNYEISATTADEFVASIPDEKAEGYTTWASYVCMLIRKYRETVTCDEMRSIIHTFSMKSARYNERDVDDWLENKYDDDKFPEDMRFPEPPVNTITPAMRQEGRELLHQAVLVSHVEQQVQIEEYGNTDEDFSVIAYKRLKSDYVYSKGQLFHKEGYIWSNDTKSFQSALRTSIIALKLKKRVVKEVKGGSVTTEVLYCEMVKNLKNVCVLTEDKIMSNQDPEFYDKLHVTTLGKLCFDDGVYDFRRKAFFNWNSEELKTNPVYSLVKIHRPFPQAGTVKQFFKETCFDKIFNESMGAENARRWVEFLSRAIAGELQDKLFATLQTNRDASKGVMNDWLMSAFGDYVKQTESKNFLIQRERSGGDAAKENAWLVDFQVVRLMLVQEFPLDMKNKGLKIDSKTIKSINSGGDKIEGRKNFKDSMTFNIQSSTVFMVNDLPAYSSEDVLEKCIQITSTVQFKSQEYIDNELKDAEGNLELWAFRKANLKLADQSIRLKVKQNDWADALVRILIDNYKDTPVVIPKALIEGEQGMRLDERVLSNYNLTGSDAHFVSNEGLREYADECGCSLKKLKAQIIGMNNKIREGIHKEGTKQLKGLRGITVKQQEE